MGSIVALLNHKGGVGKTTSAINIGAGMVELGKKVLLIDLDPQANLTLSLGIPRQKSTIYEALRGVEEIEPYTVKDGLDVVTSSLDLSGAEMELINEAGREYLLRELFEPFKEDYDYIIIDCPPSLGLLTLNALTCSRYVFIPLQTEFLALQGLTKIKQVIDKVRFRLNKQLEIGGVIATMYDKRKVLNRDVVQTIKKFFGPKVFNTLIRDNVALAEAPAQRQDIFGYNKSSNGAKDYLALCKEIIERTTTEGVSKVAATAAVVATPVATTNTVEVATPVATTNTVEVETPVATINTEVETPIATINTVEVETPVATINTEIETPFATPTTPVEEVPTVTSAAAPIVSSPTTTISEESVNTNISE